MNPNSHVGRLLHDELARQQTEPGAVFSHRLRWCEEYIDRELAFDPTCDNPQRAVRDAIAAGNRERWR